MMLRKPFGVPPLPNSYWVIPGKLLGGEYPGGDTPDSTQRRIRELGLAGVDCFVNLTSPGELPAYSDALLAGSQYFHLPIRDHGLPANESQMRHILTVLGAALDDGRCVYVHCRMGIGRTGTVLGCHLVEQGLSGEEALDALNRAWAQCARSRHWGLIPETAEQRRYVASWRGRPAKQIG